MEQMQLELDFDSPQEARLQSNNVIVLRAFVESRSRRAKEEEKAKLLAEIVRSVEHITGRSPDAEMM